MIEKAIAMALKAHKGQVDKAGFPYILHPLRVASHFIGSEELYVAAVLHDVVEDSPITIADIEKAFNHYIARIVESLTRIDREPYLTGFIPRCKLNQESSVIKRADIEDNLDPRRILAPTKENLARVKKYYKALEILRAY
jgi:(p)ppGpp synthase/HD superfamily hydrolase